MLRTLTFCLYQMNGGDINNCTRWEESASASLSHHVEVYPLNTCNELLNEQEINFIALKYSDTLDLYYHAYSTLSRYPTIFSPIFPHKTNLERGSSVPSLLSPGPSAACHLLYMYLFPSLPLSLTPIKILIVEGLFRASSHL